MWCGKKKLVRTNTSIINTNINSSGLIPVDDVSQFENFQRTSFLAKPKAPGLLLNRTPVANDEEKYSILIYFG